jgi:hypothetical protein
MCWTLAVGRCKWHSVVAGQPPAFSRLAPNGQKRGICATTMSRCSLVPTDQRWKQQTRKHQTRHSYRALSAAGRRHRPKTAGSTASIDPSFGGWAAAAKRAWKFSWINSTAESVPIPTSVCVRRAVLEGEAFGQKEPDCVSSIRSAAQFLVAADRGGVTGVLY